MSKFHQSFFYLFFFYLSCLFLLGTQGKHWLSNSFNELQDAAADKDSYALGYLALVHLHGDKGRDISMQDALAFAEASAEKNHWLGHFVMGYLARFVPYGPNPAMVKMHYLKAFQDPDGTMIREASLGDPIAAYALAEIFTSDEVRPTVIPDLNLAANYYQIASKEGYGPASVELALFKLGSVAAPDIGIPLDMKGGVELLKKVAKENLPSAHYYLGRSYFKGIGLEADKGMALVHFQAAADRGNSISQLLVADFYAYGVAGPVKLDLAFRYARLASEMEKEKAEIKIVEYQKLKNVQNQNEVLIPPPPKESVQTNDIVSLLPSPEIPPPPPLPAEPDRLPSIYTPSESPNNLPSNPNLAVTNETVQTKNLEPQVSITSLRDSAKKAYWGKGQPVNLTSAHSLFLQAANGGDGESARYLGMMFLQGKGVTKDTKQALYWFEVAAEKGDSMAVANLQKLKGILGKN